MKKLLSIAFALFFSAAAYAQNSGTVTNHAFAIGKGPSSQGFASVPCSLAQIAVGQTAADPICRTVTGDWTISAAGAATLATVNANVGTFGSSTSCVTITNNAKGLTTALSAATCTPAIGSVTGLGAGVAAGLAGAATGTGNPVFNTSPSFVTPILGAALAASINKVAITTPATSATLTIADGTTLTETTSTSVGRGQYLGEASTGNATAGNIGEYASAVTPFASAVTLTTGTNSTVISISLTAGDWDVVGGVLFSGGGTTNTSFLNGALTTTPGTLPATDGLQSTQWANSAGQVLGSASVGIPTCVARFSLSATTTVFLVAQATFTVSTQKAFGAIRARRVR